MLQGCRRVWGGRGCLERAEDSHQASLLTFWVLSVSKVRRGSGIIRAGPVWWVSRAWEAQPRSFRHLHSLQCRQRPWAGLVLGLPRPWSGPQVSRSCSGRWYWAAVAPQLWRAVGSGALHGIPCWGHWRSKLQRVLGFPRWQLELQPGALNLTGFGMGDGETESTGAVCNQLVHAVWASSDKWLNGVSPKRLKRKPYRR